MENSRCDIAVSSETVYIAGLVFLSGPSKFWQQACSKKLLFLGHLHYRGRGQQISGMTLRCSIICRPTFKLMDTTIRQSHSKRQATSKLQLYHKQNNIPHYTSTEQGRIHANPVADGQAGAVMGKPLGIRNRYRQTDRHNKVQSRVSATKNMEEGLVNPHRLVTKCITPSFPFSKTNLANINSESNPKY